MTSEDRKFSIDLARITLNASRIDALGAALGAGGIGIATSGLAIGVLDSLMKISQYIGFVGIGVIMAAAGIVVIKKNKVGVEETLANMENPEPKQEPKSEQQDLNSTAA